MSPPPLRPRRKSSRFWNALLSWELLRVSRRTGALTIGRFAFGAALLGIMWLLYSARYSHQEIYSGDVNQIARMLQQFADDFSLTFFIVQLVVVLLLTPIFVAGSVFEERETRSGEVLLTTDLTRREVFYGKFLARTVQVMMVVAAGMPVLALTLLWGGVAVEFIVVGYLTTFICIFSSGAIAVSVAGSSETMREAVLKAYAYILVFDGLIFPASPFVLLPWAQNEVGTSLCCGGIFVPIQLVITLVSLAHGLRWLRLAMLRQRRRLTTELAAQMAKRKPPVAEEDPLLWKERYVGGTTEAVSTTVITTAIVSAVGVSVLAILGIGLFPAGWVAVWALPLVLGITATTIGLSAAGGVARERQRNTLVDLFMIPGGRREILRAKLLGAFWNARWLLGAVAVLLPVSVISGTPAVAIPLLAVSAATFLLFTGALGVWLSVRCRSALNANAAWMGFIALFLIGTYLLSDAMAVREREQNGGFRIRYPTWSKVINPVMAWQDLAMTPPDPDPPAGAYGLRDIRLLFFPDNAPDLMPAIAGVGGFGLAAGLLWLCALRRFEREGREV